MTTSTTPTAPVFTSLSVLPTSAFEGKSTNGLDNGELRVVRNGDGFHVIGIDDQGRITCSEGTSVRAFAATPTGVVNALSWSNKVTVVADPADASLAFTSRKRLGVTVARGTTLVVWVDTRSGQVYATRFLPGRARPTTDWCQVMIPTAVSGNIQFAGITVAAGGVSTAAGFDDGDILLSYLERDGSGTYLSTCNLAIDDYAPEQHRWVASNPPWRVPCTTPTITASSIGSWDARTVLARVPVDDGSATFLLAGLWDEQNHKISALAWSIAADCRSPNAQRTAAIPLQWPNAQTQQAGDGICLTIDPAGRLVAAFGDYANHGDLTFGLISDLAPLGDTTTANLSFAVVAAAFSSVSSDKQDTESPLSLLFIVGDQALNRTAVPSRYPVLCTAFWITSTATTSDSTAQLVTCHYADAQIAEQVYPPPPQDGYNSKRFVSTICDPFPVPQPSRSLWDNSTPDGMTDWLLFEYAFLNGKSRTTVVNNEWKVGLTFSGEKAWANWYVGGSLGGGGQWSTMDSTYVSITQGMKVQTKGFFNPLLPVGSEVVAPYAIRPYGAYLARSMYALRQVTYTIANLAFTPAGDGTLVVLPSYSAMVDAYNEETIAGDYFAYAVVPGDIASYYEANINYRMSYLYQQLTKDMTPDEIAAIFTDYDKDGNPIDLSVYYTGGNYVRDVIRDFGVVLDSEQNGGDLAHGDFYVTDTGMVASKAKTGRKFVPFALSGSSVSDGSFTVRRGHSFGYGGYIDASVYLGYSWGSTNAGDAEDIALAIQELEGYGDAPAPAGGAMARSAHESYFQARVDFSWNIMTTEANENTSVISMNVYYNPLSSAQSLAARLYAFRPSKLWAIELAYFPALARASYIAGLKQTAAAFPQHGVTANDIDTNPDLARTISNPSSLLVAQSLPSRYLVVVTNWDSGGYVVAPEFAITASYPGHQEMTRQPSNPPLPPPSTGSGGGASDPNYLVASQPALIPMQPPSTWVGAPAGTRWISLPTGSFSSQPVATSDYVVTWALDAVPDSLVVRGQVAADDSCTILVNGVAIPNPWVGGNGQAPMYTHLTTFALPGSAFLAGTNRIVFRVNNSGGGPTGLLVSFAALG